VQYCSLKNPDPLGIIETPSSLALAGPQVVVAHFSFHTTRIDPIPAGADPLLKDLVEDGFMQGFPVLRGE
jgi:hypothetical protein